MSRQLALLVGFAICIWNDIRGEEKFPETPSPRIMYLMPGFMNIPAIEPALPSKYKAYHNKDEEDPKVFWGTGNGINTFMLTEIAHKDNPLFVIKVSPNTFQSDLTEEGMKKIIEERFTPLGIKNLSLRVFKWGEYPVVAMENEINKQKVLSVWVGLNDPSGETALITMITPVGKGHPSAKEKEIWSTFLNETKELSPQFKSITKGHDLHPGYTVITLGPARLRVVAEVRKKDRAPLIAVEPLNEDTMFSFLDVKEATIEGEWYKGTPAIKVTGTITSKEFVFDETALVIVKEVDEFTIDPSELKKNPMNVVFDGKNEDQGNPTRS